MVDNCPTGNFCFEEKATDHKRRVLGIEANTEIFQDDVWEKDSRWIFPKQPSLPKLVWWSTSAHTIATKAKPD